MADSGAVVVVRRFWLAIGARDWAAVGALVHPDVVLDWPGSNERIIGRPNVVAVNAEYPQGWEIRIIGVHGDADHAWSASR
ncbi:MAG TPA: nuclear transport factor 2 family protein [Jatrophihabitans sp.]|nr:nuclear transport factor 2 family protein [Jatrophihabitans sp.]